MDLTTAIKKSMKAYYSGKAMTELKNSSPKGIKYTKKYFDKVGLENGIDPVELKASKKDTKRGY